jgi:type IV secretory pathway VirJ component
MQAGDPGCVYNFHEWRELSDTDGTVESSAAEASPAPDAAIGTNQLVELVAATGAVRAAAESGQAADLSEAEVREVDALSMHAQSLFKRHN